MVGGRTGRATRNGPGRAALIASIGVHVLLVGAAWASGLATPSPLPPLKVYRVNIVSPPPAERGMPEPVAVNPPKVAKAEPEPPQPEPEPEPEPTPEPEPAPPEPEPAEPKPAETAVVEEPVEEKPEPEPAEQPKGANPEPEAETAGEGINIQIDGEAFPFPDYLSNIGLQIGRYFRWTGRTGLSAEIYFVIQRDGSVTDIRVLRGSGDVAFNFEAMAAIEQAGNRGAFGPLPDDFSGDRLPVAFYFEPAR